MGLQAEFLNHKQDCTYLNGLVSFCNLVSFLGDFFHVILRFILLCNRFFFIGILYPCCFKGHSHVIFNQFFKWMYSQNTHFSSSLFFFSYFLSSYFMAGRIVLLIIYFAFFFSSRPERCWRIIICSCFIHEGKVCQ